MLHRGNMNRLHFSSSSPPPPPRSSGKENEGLSVYVRVNCEGDREGGSGGRRDLLLPLPSPLLPGVFAPQRIWILLLILQLAHFCLTSFLAIPNLAMLIPIPGSLPMLSLCHPSGKLLFSLQNPAQVAHSGKPPGH